MGFLRIVGTSSILMAVIATSTALALNSLSPSSSSCYNYNFTIPFLNWSYSIPSRFDFSKTLTKPPSSVPMDAKPTLKVEEVINTIDVEVGHSWILQSMRHSHVWYFEAQFTSISEEDVQKESDSPHLKITKVVEKIRHLSMPHFGSIGKHIGVLLQIWSYSTKWTVIIKHNKWLNRQHLKFGLVPVTSAINKNPSFDELVM